MEEIMELLPLLLPIIIIQLGLAIYCLVDLKKRDTVRFNNKFIWVLIILFINLIGPIVYLMLRDDN